MKKKVFVFLFGILSIQTYQSVTFAQLGDVGSIISVMGNGAKGDASSILSAYLKPFGEGFGHDLNGGWYTTAKVHKPLGFDLSITATGAMVPSSDKSIDLNTLGLSSSATVSQGTSPTIAGDKVDGQTVSYKLSNGTKFTEFKMPQGTGLSIVPAPMVQVGLGLIKSTEVVVRFLPKTNLGNNVGSIGIFGLGVKHDIGQWIPAIKRLPFLNISAFVGYTSLKANAGIDLQPSFYTSAAKGTLVIDYSNQDALLQVNGLTTNIIASIDIPVISVYAGLGLEKSKTTLKLNGNYPFPGLIGSQLTVDDKFAQKDPVDATISNTGLKPRLNAGLKFKLGFIHLHADYTLAKYNYVSAGLAISVR
ncbi:MAG: hypothetical protein Q8928_04305 [Bacteroidota bacterium]|nr:hypothetical protein [Bacteroidota bacterium]